MHVHLGTQLGEHVGGHAVGRAMGGSTTSLRPPRVRSLEKVLLQNSM